MKVVAMFPKLYI